MHGDEAARLALERDDLVAERALARLFRDETGIHVLPVELLDGELLARVGARPLEAGEDRHGGEGRLLALGIDPVHGEAHASLELLPVAPRNGDHVVVGEGDGVLHRRSSFGWLSSAFRERATPRTTRERKAGPSASSAHRDIPPSR